MITREEVNGDWREAYEKALEECPPEFHKVFTEVLFAAQRAIGEMSIVATAEAFQAASRIVRGEETIMP